jgi:hypothetical protein
MFSSCSFKVLGLALGSLIHFEVFMLLFFSILMFELRAYTLGYNTSPFFVMGIFKIGSVKLFARAGFKPQSS